MSRQEFPRKVKLAAFQRAAGRCEECTARLVPGKYQYDHITPDGLGGKPTLDNCKVTCTACHGAKTAKEDVPRMAKADRQRAKLMDGKKSKNPMPGSRTSKWKRKMDGTVVPR